MAAENDMDGMQTIEALALEQKLIDSPSPKLEKLDYYAALQQAVDSGCTQTTHYLLDKQNVTLKNLPSNLLQQVCNGNWIKKVHSQSYGGGGETQQQRVAQLMIRKGAPSSLGDIWSYLRIARTTNASERLIKYLEEVEISKRNG